MGLGDEFARGRLFLLGLLTGVLYFIPPINLIAPIFSALAFIHLCLAELENARAGARGNAGTRRLSDLFCNSLI